MLDILTINRSLMETIRKKTIRIKVRRKKAQVESIKLDVPKSKNIVKRVFNFIKKAVKILLEN